MQIRDNDDDIYVLIDLVENIMTSGTLYFVLISIQFLIANKTRKQQKIFLTFNTGIKARLLAEDIFRWLDQHQAQSNSTDPDFFSSCARAFE